MPIGKATSWTKMCDIAAPAFQPCCSMGLPACRVQRTHLQNPGIPLCSSLSPVAALLHSMRRLRMLRGCLLLVRRRWHPKLRSSVSVALWQQSLAPN